MSDNTSSPTFEETLAELERLVEEMESGELPLEKALEKFERGIKLSRLSQQSLEQAQQKVSILLNENGEEQLAPFNDSEAEEN